MKIHLSDCWKGSTSVRIMKKHDFIQLLERESRSTRWKVDKFQETIHLDAIEEKSRFRSNVGNGPFHSDWWKTRFQRIVGNGQICPATSRWPGKITSLVLPVPCHMTLFSITLLPSTIYSTVGSETYSIHAFFTYRHLQVDFRSDDVTSGFWVDVMSFPVTGRLLRVTALKEMKSTAYASFRISTATPKGRPVKWRLFRFTSGHLVTSCHFLSRD